MSAVGVKTTRAALPLVVPQGAPPGFVAHTFETTFVVPFDRHRVWAWLNDPATFARGHLRPGLTEFVGGGFEPGVLTVHHSPLLHLAGVLGEIRPLEYRDLQYFYASYALSLRLLRPTRLQLWIEEADFGGTRVKLRVDSLVRPWAWQPWTMLQRRFWTRFARRLEAALSR